MSDLEKQLLDELKRRREITSSVLQLNDWELLIYAQHFGLATRLLDWTTNPLVALWFACSADNEEDGYVFFLEQRTLDLIDVSKAISPFSILETKVLKPSLNNQRITAQNGWFTIHAIQETTKQILPLDREPAFSEKINAVLIPGKRKKTMTVKLNILGINYETVYPGVEGTCKYLNWLNDI